MGNGTATRGPAKRDMILEHGAKHDAYLQRAIDEERAAGNLPRYEMDSEAEITGNWKQVHVKGRFPRWSLGALAVCLALGLGALLLAMAWRLTH